MAPSYGGGLQEKKGKSNSSWGGGPKTAVIGIHVKWGGNKEKEKKIKEAYES